MKEEKPDNLEIWNALKTTDPKALKDVTGKGYAMTAINAYYTIHSLTERFGPCGIGWGYNVHDEGYHVGHGDEGNKTILHVVRIGLWYIENDVKSEEIPAYGQTYFTRKEAVRGWVTDEDAPKKSLTDAITKAASFIGAGADVFCSQWDSNKYVTGESSDAIPERDVMKVAKEVVGGQEFSQREAHAPTQQPKKTYTKSAPNKHPGMGDRGTPISKAQGKRLYAITMGAGVAIEDLNAHLKEHYKVDGIDGLGWKDYERVCTYVEKEWPHGGGDQSDHGDVPDIPF